jgi:hypothetical protein
MKNTKPLQLAVLQILDTVVGQIQHEQPLYGDWSVQGFGVLRLYIRNIGRLHIWNSALRYQNVSLVHNHSWDLRSTVVCGRLVNQRYEEWEFSPTLEDGNNAMLFNRRRIMTGYDCHFVAPEDVVTLLRHRAEEYFAGDLYHQRAHEVHASLPDDGCITLMERRENSDGHANVYWPIDGAWGDAKPRRATRQEVLSTCQAAYLHLEKEIGS